MWFLKQGQALMAHSIEMSDGREVVQGPAKGWGMLFTYLYITYLYTT
jgi:delta14-sterol reductase